MLGVEVEVVVMHVIVHVMVNDVLDMIPVQLMRILHVIHHVVPMIVDVDFMTLEDHDIGSKTTMDNLDFEEENDNNRIIAKKRLERQKQTFSRVLATLYVTLMVARLIRPSVTQFFVIFIQNNFF